jgi:hypothetical protein
MIDFAIYTGQGRYVQSGNSEISIPAHDIPEGCYVYLGLVDPVKQYHDIDTDLPVDMPAKPSEYYVFNYETKQWVADTERAARWARWNRDQLLLASDWTQIPGAETRLGATEYASWQTYRQALRDITTQSGWPMNITWPTK